MWPMKFRDVFDVFEIIACLTLLFNDMVRLLEQLHVRGSSLSLLFASYRESMLCCPKCS